MSRQVRPPCSPHPGRSLHLAGPPVLRGHPRSGEADRRTVHRPLLLNGSRFSFSTKQGHKWLAGILLTEVWASDSSPPRPGTEQELEASWGAQSSVRNARQRPCLLPACLCAHGQTHRLTGIQRRTDTLTHSYTPADTHPQTHRLTQAHRDTQTDTQIHTETHRHTHKDRETHTGTQRCTDILTHSYTLADTHSQTHRLTQTDT